MTYITLHTCDNDSFLSVPGRVIGHDLGVCGDVTYITLHTCDDDSFLSVPGRVVGHDLGVVM